MCDEKFGKKKKSNTSTASITNDPNKGTKVKPKTTVPKNEPKNTGLTK